MTNTNLPDVDGRVKTVLAALLGAVVIIGGIYYFITGPSEKFPPSAITIDGQPVETIELNDINHQGSDGKAVRYFKDGKYYHEIVANLPVLNTAESYYEGWLFDGTNRYISTGRVELLSPPIHTLTFSSDTDYSDYLHVVITLQSKGSDKPDMHVLDGYFEN